VSAVLKGVIMIEVRDLTKDYGDHRAIDHLNFSVSKGEVVGFLGPNGAGKSTTMKIITGFMAPSSGEARVAGFDVFESPIEVKKRIGYLPETPPVYGDMLVRDYLEYVARLKKVDPSKIKPQVDLALEKTSLQQVQKRLIQNLSKGFRQRVGIAQALVSDPEILILDEPTVGLDPKQVAEVRHLIQELRGQHTIILSTHILPEVEATCQKVIIIHQGKIVAQDQIENLGKRQKGTSHLLVRTWKPCQQLAPLVQRISGFIKCEKGNQSHEWIIHYQGNEETISQFAQIILENGLGLTELKNTESNLEEIFLNLTYGQKPTEAMA
jgi:ABC-2 type transport system ATP-binding protein